jgi:hypothetical protein
MIFNWSAKIKKIPRDGELISYRMNDYKKQATSLRKPVQPGQEHNQTNESDGQQCSFRRFSNVNGGK